MRNVEVASLVKGKLNIEASRERFNGRSNVGFDGLRQLNPTNHRGGVSEARRRLEDQQLLPRDIQALRDTRDLHPR